MTITAVLSISVILFSVIDIIGTLPIIINMKRQGTRIHAGYATLAAGLIMTAFLFFGASILGLFGIEVTSFALAGSLIIFFIGLELTLGIRLFRNDQKSKGAGSVVPIAFPLVAGAGTLTTIISLKSEFATWPILIGIVLNLAIVYAMLRSSGWLERKLSEQTLETLRKVFGILLLAIAFQMFKNNFF